MLQNLVDKNIMTSFKSGVRRKWLPHADAFRSEWGAEMVPLKLRLLISVMHQLVSTRRNTIMWPVMLLEKDVGHIIHAVETDQYGRPM